MSVRRTVLGQISRVPIVDRHVYVARHGPARGLKRRGGLGWLPAFLPRTCEWEAEEAFLTDLEWRGVTGYDVGGDQGIFTLFFANRVGPSGSVVVIEPNPYSCRRIEQNVALNGFGNVRIVPIGLAEHKARLDLVFPPSQPALGTAVPSVAEQMKAEVNASVCKVEVNALDDEMLRSNLPPPHFIKIDVEGMEYPALQGMKATLREHRPRLSIEIHGIGIERKKANVRQAVAFLESPNYSLWHIESGRPINSLSADDAVE